jgi:hypothetical protein
MTRRNDSHSESLLRPINGCESCILALILGCARKQVNEEGQSIGQTGHQIKDHFTSPVIRAGSTG